jgi:hypothetical protein
MGLSTSPWPGPASINTAGQLTTAGSIAATKKPGVGNVLKEINDGCNVHIIFRTNRATAQHQRRSNESRMIVDAQSMPEAVLIVADGKAPASVHHGSSSSRRASARTHLRTE